MTLVLVGAHGAGKSTLGAALALRTGWSFHEELGRWLAERLRPSGATAATPQDSFDHTLFCAELARDRCWPFDRPRIVESWHPTNLAYARRRSPGVVPVFMADIRAQIHHHPVWVLPIHRSNRPQSEPGDASFFDQVGAEAEVISQELGLRCLPPLSNNGSIDSAVSQALNLISEEQGWPKSI